MNAQLDKENHKTLPLYLPPLSLYFLFYPSVFCLFTCLTLSAGILWNLSSKDSLKEKLGRETLPQLTETILVPLSGIGESGVIQQTPSEADIFYNTTGCLRYQHTLP